MEIAQACNKSRYRSMISLERIAVCERERGTDKKETERARERERERGSERGLALSSVAEPAKKGASNH